MPFPDSQLVASGRFSDVQPIGAGAYGQVYAARDNLGRAVAVKEALPAAQDFGAARARFRNEARIQATLQHPGVVAVYQLEEDAASGELYLVSELADSGSLADWLAARGLLDERAALALAADICAALEATWAQRIVHRDVKPSNILLFGGAPRAKLGDFGVAQDQKLRRTTLLPGIGHPGTPLYMAPEQTHAASLLDVRADIYALGASLWEALTGEDYKLIATAGPPRLRDLRPDLSPGLETLLRRMLEDDPARRPGSAQELARDLAAVRRGGQEPARATINLGRAAPLASRLALAEQPAPPAFAEPAPLAVVEPAPPGAPWWARPGTAWVINTALCLFASLALMSLFQRDRQVALVMGLIAFGGLTLSRRGPIPLMPWVNIMVASLTGMIGLTRLFSSGSALGGPDDPLPLVGLILTVGSAIWMRASLPPGRGWPSWAGARRLFKQLARLGLAFVGVMITLYHAALLPDLQSDQFASAVAATLVSVGAVILTIRRRALPRARWPYLMVGALVLAIGLMRAIFAIDRSAEDIAAGVAVAIIGGLGTWLALRRDQD